MDNAGLLVAACLAAVLVYRLAGRRPVELIAPSGRRAKHVALGVAVCVHAAVLLSSVTTSRHLAMHLEETAAKLTHMAQIIQNQEKHNNEMMSNLASMFSKNSGNIKWMTYKVTKPDGAENSELTITMKDDLQPPRDEIMDQEFPKRSDDHETAPVPDTAPQDEATEPHRPWRFFRVPAGHVFAVECVGDELMVHIRPASHGGGSGQRTTGDDDQRPCTCGQQQEAATPFTYANGSYRALFWSLPGEERALPVPWPRPEMWDRLTAAVLEGTWDGVDPPMVVEDTAPKSFTISIGDVMFYRLEEGKTRVLIAAAEDVEYLLYSTEEQGGPVVSALPPHCVLSTSF